MGSLLLTKSCRQIPFRIRGRQSWNFTESPLPTSSLPRAGPLHHDCTDAISSPAPMPRKRPPPLSSSALSFPTSPSALSSVICKRLLCPAATRACSVPGVRTLSVCVCARACPACCVCFVCDARSCVVLFCDMFLCLLLLLVLYHVPLCNILD